MALQFLKKHNLSTATPRATLIQGNEKYRVDQICVAQVVVFTPGGCQRP